MVDWVPIGKLKSTHCLVFMYTVVALFNAITKARQAQEEGSGASASAGESVVLWFRMLNPYYGVGRREVWW